VSEKKRPSPRPTEGKRSSLPVRKKKPGAINYFQAREVKLSILLRGEKNSLFCFYRGREREGKKKEKKSKTSYELKNWGLSPARSSSQSYVKLQPRGGKVAEGGKEKLVRSGEKERCYSLLTGEQARRVSN